MAKKWDFKLWKSYDIEMEIPTGYRLSEGHEGFYGFKKPDECYEVYGINPRTDESNPYDFDWSNCSLDINPNKGPVRKREYKGK